ncbi:hypothetical protein MRY87_11430 [bacterium]|nr:hypothetical protein [bacterium]
MYRSLRLLGCVLGLVLSLPPLQAAHAINIDQFIGRQEVTSQAGSNVVNRSVVISPQSIGGTRAIEAVSTSGLVGILTATTPNLGDRRYLHSQEVDVIGRSELHWDGDADPTTLDVTGLGGIDLTEDGGTAFILEDVGFDFAFGRAISLTVTVYDAADATGQTFSTYSLLLDAPVNFSDISIPFDTPTLVGPGGAADFSRVGALQLLVDGSNPGVDLSFNNFITNGSCPLTPGVGEGVLDECGDCVPIGDEQYNQACADCLGIPNGTTLAGDSCDTNELGECSAGIFADDCSCVRIQRPTIERCDGLDNNCNGEVDETFPELGTECGIAEEGCEVSGVFTCDVTGSARCELDLDNADLDGCGLEIGCDGVPGSGAVPNSCGVCGGSDDDATCDDLGCNSVDISETLFALDSGAKDQEALIRSTTKIFIRNTNKKRIRNRGLEIRQLANTKQILNWILTWTLPRVVVQCENVAATDFCVTSDNTGIVEEYINRAKELRDLGYQSARIVRRVTRNKTLARRHRRRHRRRYRRVIRLTRNVPDSQTFCPIPS